MLKKLKAAAQVAAFKSIHFGPQAVSRRAASDRSKKTASSSERPQRER
jgi:hypothetical protein